MGSSALDMHLMRAMGYTGKGGSEEFASIKLAMQDPGAISKVMPNLISGLGLGGMGENMGTLMLQQVMSQMGVNVGAGEAGRLKGGIKRDPLTGLDLAPGQILSADILCV